MGQGLSNQRG